MMVIAKVFRIAILFQALLFPKLTFAFHWSNLGLMPACARSAPDMYLEAEQDFQLDHAFILLWASWLAERPFRATISRELQVRGLRNVKMIGSSFWGANGFMAETEQFRLLVFRGSQDIKEWTRNAMFYQSDAQELGLPGAIHHGMIRHFKELQPEVLRHLSKDPDAKSKPLLVAGHSLGAAMALLHSITLEDLGYEVLALYISGAPRIGNKQFYDHAEQLLNNRLYAIEMADDLTPMMPPSQGAAAAFSRLLPPRPALLRNKLERFVSNLAYANPNWQTIRINSEAPLLKRYGLEGENNYWSLLKSQIQEVDSLAELWSTLEGRFDHHAPESYLCEFLKVRELGRSFIY